MSLDKFKPSHSTQRSIGQDGIGDKKGSHTGAKSTALSSRTEKGSGRTSELVSRHNADVKRTGNRLSAAGNPTPRTMRDKGRSSKPTPGTPRDPSNPDNSEFDPNYRSQKRTLRRKASLKKYMANDRKSAPRTTYGFGFDKHGDSKIETYRG